MSEYNDLIRLSVTMALQMLSPPTVSAFVSTVLSVLSLTLLLLLCVIRKKRRMEGTYKPSAEEKKQTGAAGSEKPGLPLPLPKEEHLFEPGSGRLFDPSSSARLESWHSQSESSNRSDRSSVVSRFQLCRLPLPLMDRDRLSWLGLAGMRWKTSQQPTCGVLILLVLGHQVVHVALGLVNSISSMPSPVYQ
ncbi:hypothetical protein INR49_026532 [Caranx melampygus]|nr:hypothetical protein INR49_026532 [Caranx melampygus]